jgi:hypothetical protein
MSESPRLRIDRAVRGVALGRALRPWIGAAALLLAACGGGGDGGGSTPPPGPPPPPPPPPATTAQVDITVIDTFGRFVTGATTAVGSATATTDANGHAVLTVPTGTEQVIAVSKTDFAEQFKVLNLATNATTASLRAMLIARDPAQPIASIEAGGSATGRDGVKVTFSPNALVTASGQAVTGTVQMFMTPVDVSQVDVGAFPGLFAGVAPGTTRQPIVSFGTAELVPMQGGAKLALASGASAEIELPIYSSTYQDGSAIKVGDSIPLWSLNTTTGVWEQDGSGTIVASAASPTGLAMRATIHHFSWWNSDAFADSGTVVLNVSAPGENLPATTVVNISGTILGDGPRATRSDTATLDTPRQLGVEANSTTRIEATVQAGTKTCAGSVNVSPPKNGTIQATINMVCVTVPTPRLVNPAGTTSTDSRRDLPFQIVVEGGDQRPDLVELLVDGTPVATFSNQFFYRGFWDSSTFNEGEHTLQPRATLAGIARTGGSVLVIIDRTGPQMTSTAPAADQDVDQDTEFAIDFDEPVTAAPFALGDVVRLSVLPIGQSTPVEIAFEAKFENSGSRVTVKPLEALPLGLASVSWGGLHDATGNAVTGTIAASWSVSRSARIGADLPIQSATTLTMTTDHTGVAYVLRLMPGTGDLQALRFDGSDFQPLGPIINDRPMVTNINGAGGENATIAVAGDGTVFVAFEQLDPAGTGIEIPVRSFDATSNSWQPRGTPFATKHAPATNYSARPRLAVDSLNRPVLVFIQGTLNALDAHRLDGGAWTSLGPIDNAVYGSQAGGCTVGLGGGVSAATITVSPDDKPAVALNCNDVFGASLVAVEHNGTAWVMLSGAVIERQEFGFLGAPVIRYAPDRLPWVAWFSPNQVKVVHFDGTSFVQEVLDPALRSFNGQVGLTFLNGEPVVAGAHLFHADKVDLRRKHNGVWEPQALINAIGVTSSLSLAASGDSVLIEQSGNDAARVMRVAFP